MKIVGAFAALIGAGLGAVPVVTAIGAFFHQLIVALEPLFRLFGA